MKHHRGFTVLELIIIVVIIGILVSVVMEGYQKSKLYVYNDDGTACKAGFLFLDGKQIISQNGGGVPCQMGPQ